MLSVGRRLATEGLVAGATREWAVFDPATMQNSPVTIAIGDREVVTAGVQTAHSRFQGADVVLGSHHHRVGDGYRRDRA